MTTLGRRNLAPDAAALLRGKLYNSAKKDVGAPEGNDNAKKQKAQSGPIKSTAEVIAAQTGVSKNTVKRDAQFAEAAEALGIEAAVMAGLETRPRNEIIQAAREHKRRLQAMA